MVGWHDGSNPADTDFEVLYLIEKEEQGLDHSIRTSRVDSQTPRVHNYHHPINRDQLIHALIHHMTTKP